MERNMVLCFRCYMQSVLQLPWSPGEWQTDKATMSKAAVSGVLSGWEQCKGWFLHCSGQWGTLQWRQESPAQSINTPLSLYQETKPYTGLAHAVVTSFANAQINMTIAELPCNGNALFFLLSVIGFLKFVLILAWHLDLSNHFVRPLVWEAFSKDFGFKALNQWETNVCDATQTQIQILQYSATNSKEQLHFVKAFWGAF